MRYPDLLFHHFKRYGYIQKVSKVKNKLRHMCKCNYSLSSHPLNAQSLMGTQVRAKLNGNAYHCQIFQEFIVFRILIRYYHVPEKWLPYMISVLIML
jgi:hypothetical protein